MDKAELVFNLYKDQVVVSKPFREEVLKKYKLSKEDIRNLYVRIQNYQIQKYGERITYDKTISSTEELKLMNRNARQRKYEKKSKRWEETSPLNNFFGDVLGQIDELCEQARKLKQ